MSVFFIIVGIFYLVMGVIAFFFVGWAQGFGIGFGYFIGCVLSSFLPFTISSLLNRVQSLEEEVTLLRAKTGVRKKSAAESLSSYASAQPIRKTPGGKWICKKCGAENQSNDIFCQNCGTYK